MQKPKLSEEDLARVAQFVNSGVNAVERKPFSPLKMMLFWGGVVLVLTFFSIFLPWYFIPNL